MMKSTNVFYCFLILVTVTALISPVGVNLADENSKTIEQQIPGEEFDVTITKMTFSEKEPKEGEHITISVTVKNNISESVENLNIRLMRFDQNITDKDISVDGESETTFDFEWKGEGGRQIITAILSAEVPGSNEIIPLDDMTKELWIEPEPIGDIYTPMLALALIFVVVFGTVLLPSLFALITNRSSSREGER